MIQVRVDFSHLFVCRKTAIEYGFPSDETEKTEVPCHTLCEVINTLTCSKVLHAEHMPKFGSPSALGARLHIGEKIWRGT
jgi:hypothetical protein